MEYKLKMIKKLKMNENFKLGEQFVPQSDGWREKGMQKE